MGFGKERFKDNFDSFYFITSSASIIKTDNMVSATEMKNTSMEAKREEFRKYLEKEGVLEFLTNSLVSLYEESDKPTSALDYLKNNVAGKEVEETKQKFEQQEIEIKSLKKTIDGLRTENQSLTSKVASLQEQLEEARRNKPVENEDCTPAKEDERISEDVPVEKEKNIETEDEAMETEENEKEESPKPDEPKEAEITNDGESQETSEEKLDENEKQDESNTGTVSEEQTKENAPSE